jgi:hypothetical protein
LKFNRSFENAGAGERVMRYEMPLLRRLLAKLVHDVLPAALASVVGGVLFTHFHFGRPLEPVSTQVAPASAEMMGLLRDEHALVMNYLKAEMASEEKLAADDGASRARVEPARVSVIAAPRQAVVTATKPSASHSKSALAVASRPPLVIARVQENAAAKPVGSDDDSLLAKTIGIKDRVVAVTQRAVTVFGGIPAWFGSIGDPAGRLDLTPRPPADLVSAS